jgi:hypothetical protein
MDDLRTLGAALAPDEPPQDVVDRSRHRLQNHMRGHHPIRRRSWLAVTAAAAATALAAVAAVVALPADPPDRQEALFAAAAAAERSRESTGIYWYFKVEADSIRYEYWIKPDGYYWRRYEDGKVEKMPDRRRHPFKMLNTPVTLDQLRALPTDPEALLAWVVEAVGDYDGGFKERNPLDSLVALVSMVPASPEVRVAAFRAIAAYPGVEYLGDVPGGQGVLLPPDHDVLVGTFQPVGGQPAGERIVFDPKTGQTNSTTFFVSLSGERHLMNYPGAKITKEWTDVLPS